MYLEFFGLREQPFQLTPDPHFLYPSQDHARAKAYMDYTVWRRDGFVVITGEIGAGKTTLIQNLLAEIDGKVKVIRVFQTQLNEVEFLQAVLIDLGFDPKECANSSKVELLSLFNSYLVESYAQGKHVVLIVDEAQNLCPTVLEEIRMLSGVELDKEKILNVILVGQPELNDTLDRPELQQLVQRIRLRFHVGALTEQETAEYITYRLVVAGAADGSLFEPDTIPLIYKYSGGIPRRINILCDTALICGFADSEKPITRRLVMDAVKELQWKPFERVVARRRDWSTGSHAFEYASSGEEVPETGGAPHFSAGPEQWGQLFNLVLKMLADVSARMKNVDEELRALRAQVAPAIPPDAELPASENSETPILQDTADDVQAVNVKHGWDSAQVGGK